MAISRSSMGNQISKVPGKKSAGRKGNRKPKGAKYRDVKYLKGKHVAGNIKNKYR
jgi:hypothetical protein